MSTSALSQTRVATFGKHWISGPRGLVDKLVGAAAAGAGTWPVVPTGAKKRVKSTQASRNGKGRVAYVTVIEEEATDTTPAKTYRFRFRYGGPFKEAVKLITAKNTLGSKLYSLSTQRGTRVTRNEAIQAT